MKTAAGWPVSKLLPSLGYILVAGGLSLLGWVAYSWLKPAPLPYLYQLVPTGSAADANKLDLKAWPKLKVETYEVSVPGVDNPIAVTHVARTSNAATVMLDWDNLTDEPVASLDSSFPDLAAVATAIEQHTPKDALVLTWWNTSRQLRLLTEREVAFDEHLGEPVVLPEFWQARRGAVGAYERRFWGAKLSAAEQEKFGSFADALTEDVDQGVASLQKLVGGREAYIVVRVSDIYNLALMRPKRLGVASKVFALNADIHGNINTVDQWMGTHKYSSYGLQKLTKERLRVYFLTDAASGKTLLAQMLPLTTSKPTALRAVQLVYQQGDYWIYKLPAVAVSHRLGG